MIEIANISSKGQIVIPKSFRKQIGIETKDKFLIMNENDTIILKKIKEENLKQELKELITNITKKNQLPEETINKEINNNI